ncbi:Cyclin-dependent protein kinase inhibitor SMR6 [Melia azedarach]|uniref:Cyclin-dependent protein kinase inhibitor SMR6 n=1 Tax=Melia azedarach TaxID=155640 RepID=A0ACC1YY11_MELAZ|nr:Cyclin-dependent protein kinase inhibitor SMR6 [Melia azedarach]
MVALQKKEDKEKTSTLSTKLEKLAVDEFLEGANLTVEEEKENCTTPTSKEYRIPDVVTCPPAPRKRKASFPGNGDVSGKKSRKVDKFIVSSELEAALGFHQVSCNKIPWRSKKKFH